MANRKLDSSFLRSLLDLNISAAQVGLLKTVIAVIIASELIVRLVFVEQLYLSNFYAPFEPSLTLLKEAGGFSFTHCLFFLSDSKLYLVVLLILGLALTFYFAFGTMTRLGAALLAAYWVNLYARSVHLNHSGDRILFFLIILFIFIGNHKDEKSLNPKKTFLVLLQIFLIFFCAGFNKLNSDWLSGEALQNVLQFGLFSNFNFKIDAGFKPFFVFLNYYVLAFEIFMPFLIFFRRLRNVFAVSLISFGIMLFILFSSQSLAILVITMGFVALSGHRQTSSKYLAKQNFTPINRFESIAISCYIVFIVFSSVINTLMFDEYSSRALQNLNLDRKYFLAQRWDFFSEVDSGSRTIRIESEDGFKSEYEARNLGLSYSKTEAENRVLSRRSAKLIQRVVWKQDHVIDSIFTAGVCNKLSANVHHVKISIILEKQIKKEIFGNCHH